MHKNSIAFKQQEEADSKLSIRHMLLCAVSEDNVAPGENIQKRCEVPPPLAGIPAQIMFT